MQTQSVAVIDFDHHSAEISARRDSVIDRVRHHPIFYTEAHDGYWVVTSHALARRVLRDKDFGTQRSSDGSSGGITIPQIPLQLLPAEADGDYHLALRRVLNPLFARAAVDRLMPVIEQSLASALDDVIERGEFDVVHDIGHVFPATVILRYLGVPVEHRQLLNKIVQAGFATAPEGDDDAARTAQEEAQKIVEAFGQLHAMILDLVENRRAHPADDIISAIVHQNEVTLSPDETVSLVITLIAGGTENVQALMASTTMYLEQHRDLRQKLIRRPELIEGANEEFMRFFTPAVSTVRHARRDLEVGGVSLPEGSRVLVWLPATNQDESVFTCPATLDLDRDNLTKSMAFGDGPHRCVGAALGRVEAALYLRELLRRIPDYVVDVDKAARFTNPATMYGWWSMPARCTP